MELSKTEFETLSLLVSNPGRVFSQQELLDAVWPQDAGASPRNVDADIRHIRALLGDLSSHILNKSGYGYYFE
ncbi:MAG: winged helix-turn-helix domain-containing protein [Bacteroidales bacterium]|nr:winged helix-turn-helix domain-containing protein [Bacteroidales bacterium]